MRAKVCAHARLEDRDAARRSQAASVDDAHASVAAAARGVKELLGASHCRCGGHPVKIVVVSREILTAFQLSDLAAVNAMRGEVRVRLIVIDSRAGGGRSGGAKRDRRSGAHAPASVWRQRDNRGVGHRASEGVRVGAVSVLVALLHPMILCERWSSLVNACPLTGTRTVRSSGRRRCGQPNSRRDRRDGLAHSGHCRCRR
jgi:hypothetical protein